MEPKLEKLGRDLQESLKRLLREYAEALVLALILALVLRHFVLASYKVTSESMAPMLKAGDFILGLKLPYGAKLPFAAHKIGRIRARRGDIAILKCQQEPAAPLCLKRVIGLPGDRLEIVDHQLMRNGQPISTVKFPAEMRLLQIVPPDKFFVSSDQFGFSSHNFEWGLVSEDRFEARALLIWFSQGSPQESTRWNRIGQMIR
jgi:signal peptidase I